MVALAIPVGPVHSEWLCRELSRLTQTESRVIRWLLRLSIRDRVMLHDGVRSWLTSSKEMCCVGVLEHSFALSAPAARVLIEALEETF